MFCNSQFKCHDRFDNRYELATENNPIVANLLSMIEEIFTHGLLLTKRSNKILGNKLFSNILNKNDTNLYFWNYITLFLTEHELKRFLSLRYVVVVHGYVIV
ncbi:hypothetical protein BLA29_010023 [Euroglyphus maynei]|uniref:RUN domain-containing protein n=1 Tax=Euroglyphus maynei TaxID=6958 RepID=A0A1Y3AS48_EURMA|nr:hypothetical protein BLA29_010023 [Euroglyphus maynei]